MEPTGIPSSTGGDEPCPYAVVIEDPSDLKTTGDARSPSDVEMCEGIKQTDEVENGGASDDSLFFVVRPSRNKVKMRKRRKKALCGGNGEEAGRGSIIPIPSVCTKTCATNQDAFQRYFEEQTGIHWTWPEDKTPLRMVGCFVKDRTLCYVIQHSTEPPSNEPSPDNVLIVRGAGFRKMYPSLVITYYEDSVNWLKPTETQEQIQEKVSKEMKRTRHPSAQEEELNFDVDDDDLDEDGLPLPPEKRANYENPNTTIMDKFGLSISSEPSDSSDNDEYEEIQDQDFFASNLEELGANVSSDDDSSE